MLLIRLDPLPGSAAVDTAAFGIEIIAALGAAAAANAGCAIVVLAAGIARLEPGRQDTNRLKLPADSDNHIERGFATVAVRYPVAAPQHAKIGIKTIKTLF